MKCAEHASRSHDLVVVARLSVALLTTITPHHKERPPHSHGGGFQNEGEIDLRPMDFGVAFCECAVGHADCRGGNKEAQYSALKHLQSHVL